MNIKKRLSAIMAITIIGTSTIVPNSYANQLNEYETYIKPTPKSYNIENLDLPEEVKLDLQEEQNIKYFKTKTNSNYEVALAYEDGSSTFYKEAQTIAEAKEIANSIKAEYEKHRDAVGDYKDDRDYYRNIYQFEDDRDVDMYKALTDYILAIAKLENDNYNKERDLELALAKLML